MTQYQPPNDYQQQQPYGQSPYGQMPPQPMVEEKNTVGLVGFIVSLVSIITCGLLAPIGLLISFIGLFKRPRGFAVAGTVLGLVLSVGMIVGVVALVQGFRTAGGFVQQGAVIWAIQTEAQTFYQQNGRLPDKQELDQQVRNTLQSTFGSSFQQVKYEYRAIDATTYEMRLPGFDKQFNTSDDITETATVTPAPGSSGSPGSPGSPGSGGGAPSGTSGGSGGGGQPSQSQP